MAIELASKIYGKGLQVPRKAGMGLHVSPKPFFMATSPFLWNSGGPGGRSFVGRKQSLQQHSDFGNNIVSRPPFKDIPLSNYDLLDWVKFLRIKNFKGIFSRDAKDHLHKTGSCIINLDDSIGNGTHWVATNIKGKKVFYFDSFSIPPPMNL